MIAVAARHGSLASPSGTPSVVVYSLKSKLDMRIVLAENFD
jgi:hypothetical protein